MSKKVSKKTKEEVKEPKDSDLLAPESKEEPKPKTLIGFHPITNEEVWE
jgi:hypothetical protein